jgi:hypothetical protein
MVLIPSNEPSTYTEAENEEQWQEAMCDELASIKQNNMCSLTDLPVGHKPIGLKWVYKLK